MSTKERVAHRRSHLHTRTRFSGRAYKLSRLTIALYIVVICMTLVAIVAHAQQRCVPVAGGVPGLGGPPNWFGPTTLPSPQFWPQEDDPRWNGALADTFVTGTDEEARFRALYDTDTTGQRYLYLAFNAKKSSDAGATTASQHRVYIGLSDNVGTTAVVFRINLTTLAPSSSPDIANTNFDARMYKLTGTTWGAQTPPAWLADPTTGQTRVWIKNSSWAVHLRIPLTTTPMSDFSNGVSVGGSGTTPASTFLLWFTIMRGTPAASTSPPPIIAYKLPRTSPTFTTDDTSLGNPDFPPPTSTNWQPTRFSTGPTDPGCSTEGVSLYVGDIGTTNPVSSEIKWKIPSGSTTRPTNTFYARPRNNTTATIPAGGIRATFRIANWGSQIDPNVVASPSPGGSPIVLWDTIPGGSNVPNSDPIPVASPPIPAGSWLPYPAPPSPATPIHFDWQLTDAEASDFQGTNPRKRTHQCMLVELSGGGLTFFNDSVVRNMDFEDASTMRREAEISVVGLTPIAGTGPRRDVYLIVETQNMPAVVKPTPVVSRARRPGVGTGGMTGAGMTTQQLDSFMPTYKVYAYHDTGTTLRTEAGVFRILEPQGSFGYYVRHDGDLGGWRHRLDGAQQIGPNFYLIKVPNNGTSTIYTTIEALPSGGGGGSGFFSLGLRGGVAVPHSPFSNLYDPGGAFTADLEYHATNFFSVSGQFGYRRFSSGSSFVPGFNLFQFSGGPKVYLSSGSTRPFLNGGIGAFKFDPGSKKFGVYTGGGLQFRVWPNLWLEGEYDFHSVFTTGQNFKFSTVQGGIRIRF